MDERTTRLIVLASGSRTRQHMLSAAGVQVSVAVPDVDEAALRRTLERESGVTSPAAVAEWLARAKATDVSARYPGALVVAADQVLACEGKVFCKAADRECARATLLALRGREHQLHAAVAVAEDGEVGWVAVDTARMRMRDFSPAFLDAYLRRAGAEVLESVGGYKVEGLGIQLFERIEGDHFTILGLPLMPLLGELRSRGVLPA